MSNVLDGGEGVTSGGNEDKSSESGAEVFGMGTDLGDGDGDGDIGGELAASIIVKCMRCSLVARSAMYVKREWKYYVDEGKSCPSQGV